MSLVCGRNRSARRMTEYQEAGCSRGWMQQLEIRCQVQSHCSCAEAIRLQVACPIQPLMKRIPKRSPGGAIRVAGNVAY